MNQESTGMDRKSRASPLVYGMPRLGTSIVLGIEGFALFTLYTTGYGLDEFRAGLALSMGYLSIAVAQFLFGWLSDVKYTRLGRRKPFLLAISPLLCVSFIFLHLPGLFLPDLNDKNALFSWMLAWDVVFRACYGMTSSYQAWMAELFPVKERPRVSQIQNVFNYIGNGVMGLLTIAVFTGVFDTIKADVNAMPSVFLISILVFGILVVALFYAACIMLPTEKEYTITSKPIRSLVSALKNRKFLIVVLMQGVSGLGWSMLSTVMLKFADEVLGLSTIEYAIVAVCLILGMFFFLRMWRKRIETKGKKSVLLNIFMVAFAVLPVTLVGLVPMPTKLPLAIIFALGAAAALGGWFLYPYIMYADLAEDDQKSTTSELRAGVYQGFPYIVLNLFQSLGSFILGIITSLPDVTVDTRTFSIGLVLFGPISSCFLLVAYFFTKKKVVLDFKWEKAKE
ncbi:MAG: MFS transporter [Candidatus Hodarchaeota archaeon]